MAHLNRQGEDGLSAEPPTKPENRPLPPKQLSGPRKWLFRFAAMILGPVLALGILELSLRAAGYGQSMTFFKDGSDIERQPVWIDNPNFGRWVFPSNFDHLPEPVPFVLPKTKAPNTCRIFVLGESAAMGFPDYSTSFSRVLEIMLQARYPDTRFEVVNAAMVAINSHVVLKIGKQCADCDPDLIVVHVGNNEVVGPFGAAGVLGPFSPNLRLIRANLALKSTRSGQLLGQCIQSIASGKSKQQSWSGMGMFINSRVRAGDERFEQIYSHFRTNLDDLCRVGKNAKVPMILCTIPVNLRDSAPFASLHSPGLSDEQSAAWDKLYRAGMQLEAEGKFAEAIQSYLEAKNLDAGFAEAEFRLGKCYVAVKDGEQARLHFLRARDLDAIRFRADSQINAIIRDTASANAASGVQLADAERAFAQNSPGEIPGDELFLEHVHMTFKGNCLLGRTLFETIATSGLAALGESSGNQTPLTEQQCAERLACTDWNEFHFRNDMYEQLIQALPFTLQYDHAERCRQWEEKLAALRKRLDSGGIQKAADAYEAALQTAKSDWMIRKNFGQLLIECNRLEDADRQFQSILVRIRHYWAAYSLIGRLAIKLDRPKESETQIRAALKLDPENLDFHVVLADALEHQSRNAEAQAVLETLVRKNPKNTTALRTLGRFYVRSGKLDDAKARLSEALEGDPNSAELRVDLGMIAVQQKNLDEAKEHLEAAAKLRPDWPDIQKHLADLEKERLNGLPADQK